MEEEKRKMYSNMRFTMEYTVNGDDWAYTVHMPHGAKTFQFCIGEEFDSFTLDGRPIKVNGTRGSSQSRKGKSIALSGLRMVLHMCVLHASQLFTSLMCTREGQLGCKKNWYKRLCVPRIDIKFLPEVMPIAKHAIKQITNAFCMHNLHM
jgi:hypothetical protein